MICLAIVQDVLRHAWRTKLPVVILLAILLLFLSMPSFLVSDGSFEGKLKLFLLYSGNMQVFILAMIATIWTIWLEKLEQKNNVHCMIAVKPLKRLQVLTYRLFGNFLILMVFFLLTSMGIAYMASRMVHQANIPDEAKGKLTAKLQEVRTKMALPFSKDIAFEGKRLNGNNLQVIPLEHGKPVSYKLELPESKSAYQVEGYVGSNSSKSKITIQWRVTKNNEVLGFSDKAMYSNNTFRIRIPPRLSELSPLELHVAQFNEKAKPVYLLKNKPVSLTIPIGSIYMNMLMATVQLSLLGLSLIALSMCLSQFMSMQGAMFVGFAIFLTGFFRENIHGLIFRELPVYPGVESPPLSSTGVFYTILWKPILTFIPDFSRLNPSTAVSNGEWITWSDMMVSLTQVLPFLLIIFVLLFFTLPRQELGNPK